MNTTENHHHVELKIASGELVTGFTCSAPADASCRRRPKDHDQRESWSTEEATEVGFRCWAVEWVEAVGTADAVIGSADAVLASVPVAIYFEEGVGIKPITTSAASRGVDLIAQERTRQIADEGHTPEGDRHQGDLLARAGVEYANVAVAVLRGGPEAAHFDPPLRWNWPWSNEFWKPSEDPIRDLTKAGALIAAAIDSLIDGGMR
ncbi:hypothetical protein KZC52_16830 [Microbacterium sp. kSW2-24]|uniref:hypothetical protein n=1 Tax=Microbacterium galbinum TaxID=2851646 RepID=UPI001FFD145F|nr:hypothetical protein [Microbacterium galbinum]MCK2024595.1 hypothetical protein [Microbacterium galbinum]